ncbi:MAG: hypothetical protein J6L86_08350 [Alphaproteobacteria bacterium]|nr:hypothetical protein [Alphaproteobacteria bacterium]
MRITKFHRYFIIITALLLLAVYIRIQKNNNQNIFEPTVRLWCDSNLPLDKIVDCVNKQYQSSRFSQNCQQQLQRRNTIKQAMSDQPQKTAVSYADVTEFKPLKEENSIGIINSGPVGKLSRTDKYGTLHLHLPQMEFPFFTLQKVSFPDKKNHCRTEIENILTPQSISYWHYPCLRPMMSTDFLITKNKKEYKIFATGYETARLKDNKALFTISILSFCPQKDKFTCCGINYFHFIDDYPNKSDFKQNQPIPETLKKRKGFYEGCPPYPQKFAISPDTKHPEQIIHLSADSRHNPSTLYIKLYNRVFAVNVSETKNKGKHNE